MHYNAENVCVNGKCKRTLTVLKITAKTQISVKLLVAASL